MRPDSCTTGLLKACTELEELDREQFVFDLPEISEAQEEQPGGAAWKEVRFSSRRGTAWVRYIWHT